MTRGWVKKDFYGVVIHRLSNNIYGLEMLPDV